MGAYFENFGISVKDEKALYGLAKNVVQNGRALRTYYGHSGYVDYEYGSMQIALDIRGGEEANEIVSLDTQCTTHSIWEVRVAYSRPVKERVEGTRKIVVTRCDNGAGMAAVSVINPDVLPSYAEDEILTLQMAAFPEYIAYYPTREAYEDTIEPLSSKVDILDGKKLILAEGGIFPYNLFAKRVSDSDQAENDEDTEDIVIFNAEVQKVEIYKVSKTEWFYAVTVNTKFGELTIAHSESMVTEEQRPYIVPGSTVVCIGHLVADPALFEFAKGAVFDSENDLKLLRHCCMCGEADRMRGALTEDVIYERTSDHEQWTGIQEVIDRFQYVYDAGEKCRAFMGTVEEAPDGNSGFAVGTRCLALVYGEEDTIASLMAIETDGDEKIRRISTIPYEGYVVVLDDQSYYDGLQEDTDPFSREEVRESQAMKLRRLLMAKIRNSRTMEAGMGLLDGLPRDRQESKAAEIIAKIEDLESAEEVQKVLEEMREL